MKQINNRMTGAAALSLAALLAGCSKGPESTIESFYYSLGKGEVNEAKGYVSKQLTEMLGDSKISAALVKEVNRIRNCGGIKSVEAKLQGEGDVRSGTALITFAGNNCKPIAENTKMIKEDGKWKITASK